MARSIVLRFDATCHDCGRSLSAGTTARWFGKGRVSCCGGSRTADAASAAVAPSSPAVAPLAFHNGNGNGAAQPPAPRFGAATAGLDAELANAVRVGLTPSQCTRLAQVCPHQMLLVRLQSGARFTIAARDVQHVVFAIEESCRDRVRDIMGAAQ